jgi:hypothetical protein
MDSETYDQILKAEERLRQAMLHSEVSVLDELIAPELLFTNHAGQLVSKDDDLAAHRSGALQLKELVPSQQQIRLHPRFAVVSVLMHLLGSYESTPVDVSIRYTRVWSIYPDGSMRIVAGHASVAPPSSH